MDYSCNIRRTIVFDFDGVIHSYTSGWQGIDVINDPPVEGIKECIDDLRIDGYDVVIVSTRCHTDAGKEAIERYLRKHQISHDGVVEHKPPAIAYVDDRAICFDGDAFALKDKIENFKSYLDAKR